MKEEKNLRKTRIAVLKTLRDHSLSQGYFHGLNLPELCKKTGFTEEDIKPVWTYLTELKYTIPSNYSKGHPSTWQPEKDATLRITARGIVYYEDESSKIKQQCLRIVVELFLVILGATLGVAGTLFVQHYSPQKNFHKYQEAPSQQEQISQPYKVPGDRESGEPKAQPTNDAQ